MAQFDQVAVLDMKPFLDGSNKKFFADELRKQCHEVGLFYVKNHGVSQELCDRMMNMSQRFFQLPLSEKMVMDYRNSPQFRGYMQLGMENTAGLTDFREQVQIGPDEEPEFDLIDGDVRSYSLYPLWRRLRGRNQWPQVGILPGFKNTTEEFMSELVSFSMKLKAAIALSLGLSEDFFQPAFDRDPHYQMKLVRYPDHCSQGVGAHSDSGFLSLLLQDEAGGLQAKLRNGVWIDVPFKQGTFVVNLGEMLQLATGGYYLATVHRVADVPRSRISVPFFFNPRLDARVEAVDQFRSCEGGIRGGGGESTHGGRNKLLPVFGDNTFKSFVRSHRVVVQTHHADLVDKDF